MVLAFASCGRYNTRPFVTVSTSLPDQRAWVDVHLGHLLANARTILSVARGASLLPMVKANAYGLGAARVAEALQTLEPWGHGVATLDEGVELRRTVAEWPILVFTPASADLQGAFREHRLRAVLEQPVVAATWDAPFHIEVDTGMGRCGVRWDDRETLAACAMPQLEGAFTHFHSADKDPESVALQWKRFATALAALPVRPSLVHAANSAGAWRLQRRLDLVRPGIFLYGGRHAPDLPAPLPVAQVRARVVSLRVVPPGDSVSYGGEWTAERETTVATLGIGYADGVPRTLGGSGAHVLLGGRPRPIIGRVTMDFIMVALQPDDRVRLGDVATVIGLEGREAITLDQFAAWGSTNSYEVLTRLGNRLPRRYDDP